MNKERLIKILKRNLHPMLGKYQHNQALFADRAPALDAVAGRQLQL